MASEQLFPRAEKSEARIEGAITALGGGIITISRGWESDWAYAMDI